MCRTEKWMPEWETSAFQVAMVFAPLWKLFDRQMRLLGKGRYLLATRFTKNSSKDFPRIASGSVHRLQLQAFARSR